MSKVDIIFDPSLYGLIRIKSGDQHIDMTEEEFKRLTELIMFFERFPHCNYMLRKEVK